MRSLAVVPCRQQSSKGVPCRLYYSPNYSPTGRSQGGEQTGSGVSNELFRCSCLSPQERTDVNHATRMSPRAAPCRGRSTGAENRPPRCRVQPPTVIECHPLGSKRGSSDRGLIALCARPNHVAPPRHGLLGGSPHRYWSRLKTPWSEARCRACRHLPSTVVFRVLARISAALPAVGSRRVPPSVVPLAVKIAVSPSRRERRRGDPTRRARS